MNQEIGNYIEYLFALALKKCGDLHDAEDLTQETLLAACQYLNRGGTIANLKYWLTSTLSHKWNDMLRKKYKLPFVCIDSVEDTLGYAACDEEVNRPTADEIRREIAYLAKLHREVIVLHYLHGMKVDAIAEKLAVPRGTVLSRLSAGREQIRKGFDEMENYEKQSYSPDRLDISCHGCPGFHDEPYSLVANDMMKQNILLAAYEKPITCVEISKALGIPTAYIEQSISDLVKFELMMKCGNKVFTDFMITTPEQQLKALDAEIALTEQHYDEILLLVNQFLDALRSLTLMPPLTDSNRKKLEYYFVLHLFTTGIYTAVQGIVPSKEEFPQRPGGGNWIAVGSNYPMDFDYENYRFRKYCYGGERRAYWENFLNSKSIHLRVYDTQPDLNLYEHGPVEIHDDNLAKLLYIISRGIPFQHTGFNLMFCEDIPHLTKCGILGIKDETVFVNLPILTPDEYRMFDNLRTEYMYKFANLFEPWLREISPKLKIDIPKHLVGRISEFRQYSCYAIPMAFVKIAAEAKEFDAAEAAPPMVFIVDDENKDTR